MSNFTIEYEEGWFASESEDVVEAVAHAQRNGRQPVGEVITLRVKRQGKGWEWERVSRHWSIREDPELQQQLERGIEDARQGKTVPMDFSEYLEDDE